MAESPRQAASVRVSGLSRAFTPGAPVLEKIDLAVDPGEFVALLGPSGCGKSTLLRLIAGLDRQDSGTVQVVTPGTNQKSEPAYVFQDPTLLPWRTVGGNAALPLELRGKTHAEATTAAHEALVRVGLADAERLYPAQLSGGMRMRASLARALATKPNLLLLDEPFSALDEPTRHALQEDLNALWRAGGMTVIFVTHSIAEAAFLAQRVVVLSPRPAGVVLDARVVLPKTRDNSTRIAASYLDAMQRIQGAMPEVTRSGTAQVSR